jgi:hypothetical protein
LLLFYTLKRGLCKTLLNLFKNTTIFVVRESQCRNGLFSCFHRDGPALHCEQRPGAPSDRFDCGCFVSGTSDELFTLPKRRRILGNINTAGVNLRDVLPNLLLNKS